MSIFINPDYFIDYMDAIEELKRLTTCKEVKLVNRGNKAIQYALRIAKALGKTKVLIQDQGGWLTYPQYPPEMNLDLIKLKTDFGLIDRDELFRHVDKDSVLLICSMPGYHALQDMLYIMDICREAGCLVINDVTGSISTDTARYGDIIVGSFGEGKPIPIGQGGFIGVKDPDMFKLIVMEEVSVEGLSALLETLDNRLEEIQEIRKKILRDLRDNDIIHRNKQGINIIVRFSSEIEKEKIINYCESNNYEFTLCPRYIRVEVDAISIELKKMFKGD